MFTLLRRRVTLYSEILFSILITRVNGATFNIPLVSWVGIFYKRPPWIAPDCNLLSFLWMLMGASIKDCLLLGKSRQVVSGGINRVSYNIMASPTINGGGWCSGEEGSTGVPRKATEKPPVRSRAQQSPSPGFYKGSKFVHGFIPSWGFMLFCAH